MVTTEGRQLVLRSRTSGRVLGRFRSRKKLVQREKQIRFFANVRKSTGGEGSLLAKVSPQLRQKELGRRRKLRR